MKRNIKKTVSAFLAILLLCGILPLQLAVSAEEAPDFSWSLENGVLTISGTGDMPDFDDGFAPWYDQNESITKAEIKNGITSIGEYAFRECGNLTSVTIPESVTSIGGSAFSGCGKLEDLTIPDSVTNIGKRAFFWCSNLTEIKVGENNTHFSSEDGVLLNKDKTEIIYCPGGKSGAYVIPDGVTSIGVDAFYHCESLTSITMPGSVTSIGDDAFAYCCGLTSVTIPDSVTSIGDGAFAFCCSLTSVTIPDSVSRIGEQAFYNCSSLKDVYLPAGLTVIGEYAFGNEGGFEEYCEEGHSSLFFHVHDNTYAKDYVEKRGWDYELIEPDGQDIPAETSDHELPEDESSAEQENGRQFSLKDIPPAAVIALAAAAAVLILIIVICVVVKKSRKKMR